MARGAASIAIHSLISHRWAIRLAFLKIAVQVDAWHLFESLAARSRGVSVEAANLAEEPRARLFSALDMVSAGVPVEPARVQPWMTIVVPLLLGCPTHFLFRRIMWCSSRVIGSCLHQFRQRVDERLVLFAAVPNTFLSRRLIWLFRMRLWGRRYR